MRLGYEDAKDAFLKVIRLDSSKYVVWEELLRLELLGLALQDVLGELAHIGQHLHVLDVGEIFLRAAHLVPGDSVLDVACGTGKLTAALA